MVVFLRRRPKPANMVDACKALEKANAFPASRAYPNSAHAGRVSMKFEITGMFGHVGADVDPNHMDASVVLSIAQWING